MTLKITREESRRVRHQKLVGLTLALLWMVPGVALSALFESAIPALVAVFLCLVHTAVVSRRMSTKRKAHRVAFWAGKVDVLEPPDPRVIDEIGVRRWRQMPDRAPKP